MMVLALALALWQASAVTPPPSPPPDGPVSKNVLILYSHEREQTTYAALDAALRTSLQSKSPFPIAFYTEYLDLLRFGTEEHQGHIVDYLRLKYRSSRFDLVIVVSSLAFDFVMERGRDLFGDSPILFTSVNVSHLAHLTLPSNMTGISVTRDYKDTIELALGVHPDTEHIVIPVGSSPPERQWTADMERDLASYQSRASVTFIRGLPFGAMLERLRNLPPHTVVFFSSLYYDSAGRYLIPEEALAQICAVANAPVYGINKPHLGLGIVGGVLYDLEQAGAATGEMGRQILTGVPPWSIAVRQINPNRAMFDARQLARWKIDEARLPPDALVFFRESTLWQQYGAYIVAGSVAFAIQTLLVLTLVAQGRKLRHSETLMKDLSGHLINAQDEERKRIARELHDDFGQRLALLKIELEMLARGKERIEHSDSAELGHLLKTMDELTTDVHFLSHRLHSSKLQFLGLQSALNELCQDVTRQWNIVVELRAGDLDTPVAPELALCLYRIAQEALHNAAKHSRTSRIAVTLSEQDHRLRLAVADFGRGFEPTKASDGLGLVSMRERLRMIGGELTVQSAPGRGTTVTAEVELLPSDAAASL